jgi:tRNA (cmo5U34)-methyltransferase
MDAPLAMELITQAACAVCPGAKRVLDIGCGAGNNTLKLMQTLNPLDCDLVDLSLPMLKKAEQRIREINTGKVRIFQGDFRKVDLKDGSYDIILAAAVLHHLRDENDWREAFNKIFRLTAKGGSVWITDLVFHDDSRVHQLMWRRYGDFLESAGGANLKKKVFDNIEKEDSPRSVTFQINLLKEAGFTKIDILHKNSCYAAFGAVK